MDTGNSLKKGNKLWLVMLCLVTPSALQADSTQQLWTLLSTIHTFQATFTQTSSSPTGHQLQSSSGLLSVGGDAKFVIETYTPYPQTLVSDGGDFWSYDPGLEQVVVTRLSLNINKVPILLFGSQDKSLLDAYHVTAFETEDLKNDLLKQDVLKSYVLEPKASDSLFELLTLSFREDIPVSISLIDALEQKTHLQLSKILINQDLDPGIFKFTPPPGIDVIDER